MPYRKYDAMFPTIVRYVGLTLVVMNTVVIFTLAFIGHTDPIVTLAGLYVPLAGLILYKTVKNAAEEEDSKH